MTTEVHLHRDIIHHLHLLAILADIAAYVVLPTDQDLIHINRLNVDSYQMKTVLTDLVSLELDTLK